MSELAREAARLKALSLLDLFAADPARASALTFDAPHLTLDISKQRIDGAALAALLGLCTTADVEGWRARMFAGEAINGTERRAVKHWALRAPDAGAEIFAVRAQMRAFAQTIRGGIDAIVHIGIGGSDLGPRLVMDALRPLKHKALDVRFATNVDAADMVDALEGLDPSRTLVIVASKTFTTQETLMNARFARAWGATRFAAATAAPEKAAAWGVAADHIFPFWDWVGGRYSLWSSVGLVCAIALADNAFDRLLAGAADLDAHFRTAPADTNVPIVAAALQHWNREALSHMSYAVLPYAERLRLLPAWLQQLEMESNGKRVTRDGAPLAHSAAGVTWGAAGTNAQHSFFQLLHQGVEEIPTEFIILAEGEGPTEHRTAVLANALAQTRALMVGKTQDQAAGEMRAAGMSEAEAARLAPHRTFPGNRASTILALKSLTPEALGALLAFYEHRTFVQGVLAGVNSFDQYGVELGKEMAGALAPALDGGAPPPDLDPSTASWLQKFSRQAW